MQLEPTGIDYIDQKLTPRMFFKVGQCGPKTAGQFGFRRKVKYSIAGAKFIIFSNIFCKM